MKNNDEEYAPNHRRDWMIFGISLVAVVVILLVKPEWVWVTFPFLFTSLGGALGKL
jgi:hypothetical protein